MHRSRWIWPINGLDLISILHSVEATRGYRRLPHRYCDSDRWGQQGWLIKHIDQWPKLNHDIASVKHKGEGLWRPKTVLLAIVILQNRIGVTPWSGGRYPWYISRANGIYECYIILFQVCLKPFYGTLQCFNVFLKYKGKPWNRVVVTCDSD